MNKAVVLACLDQRKHPSIAKFVWTDMNPMYNLVPFRQDLHQLILGNEGLKVAVLDIQKGHKQLLNCMVELKKSQDKVKRKGKSVYKIIDL